MEPNRLCLKSHDASVTSYVLVITTLLTRRPHPSIRSLIRKRRSRKKCSLISRPRSNRVITCCVSCKNAIKMRLNPCDGPCHSSMYIVASLALTITLDRHKLDESAIDRIRRRSAYNTVNNKFGSPMSLRRSETAMTRVSCPPKANVKVLSADEKVRLKGR